MGDCSDHIGHGSLTCRDVNDFLVDYLEEGLDDQVRDRFESHLEQCPKCTSCLDEYRSLVKLIHEADEVPRPPDLLVDYTLAFLRQHYGDSQGEDA